MANASAQIDSTVEIVTPENIAFHYQVAGPFRRLPAFLLDQLIRVAIVALFLLLLVLVGMTGILTNLGGMVTAVFFIGWFLLDWFYGGVLETWLNGQTPGKWVMGIRVLSVDGQPINGLQAMLRNILRTVDFFPLVYYFVPAFTFGLVVMTMNKRFQRLGDIVCGTIVVVEERKWLTGIAKLDDPRIAQLASYIPADYRVSRSLARTLSAYVERRRFFSLPRRREVARHLAEPLMIQFGFPPDTSYDLLLCALYFRTFVADRGDEDRIASEFGVSPFGTPKPLPPMSTLHSAPTDSVPLETRS
jgi:uncharacterized RDD family membrane protein YckC